MTTWLLACLLCGTGVPARAPLGGTDIPVRAAPRSVGVPPTGVAPPRGTGVPARAPLGGTDISVRAGNRSVGVPPTNKRLTYFDKGTKVVYDVDGCAHFFALTPSPSPTAWERRAERVHGTGRFPSPFTERGLVGEVEQDHPTDLHLDRNVQATDDAPLLERDSQATDDVPLLERDAQATDDVPLLERDAQATGSLWNDKSGSLFEDFKARRVGDLVTIVVVESTTASARANTDVQKSESASTTAGVGPLLDFLWPELGASGRTDSKVQGNTARAGTLQTRITVQVVETFPNGVLRIEGRRTLKINEETQTLVFSGLVRIRDIRADNTVPSTAIANAQIFFEGKGIVGSRQREGILTRLFKIIF